MSSLELGAKDLGTKVSYVRFNKDDKDERGFGILVNLSIDPTGHIVGIVRKGGNTFNIDLVAINATLEQADAYIEKVKAIRQKAVDANAAIRAITDQANAEIKVLQADVVGDPITYEEVPDDLPAANAGDQVAA